MVRDGFHVTLTEPTPGSSEMTLLCLPGTMCSPRIFECLNRVRHQVVVLPCLEWPSPHDMDTLGQTVAELAERYRPAILVGHSTGGVIALSAALRATSAAVRGILLCDTGANVHGHGDVDAVIDRVVSQWGPPFWEQFLARSVYTAPSAPLRDELARYPARLSVRAVESALRSQRDTDLLPELHRLATLPALVLQGEYDTARTPEHANQLATALGAPEPTVLQCGHTPPAELPTQFADIVAQWLEDIDDNVRSS